jgi:hypothetical protein
LKHLNSSSTYDINCNGGAGLSLVEQRSEASDCRIQNNRLTEKGNGSQDCGGTQASAGEDGGVIKPARSMLVLTFGGSQ